MESSSHWEHSQLIIQLKVHKGLDKVTSFLNYASYGHY